MHYRRQGSQAPVPHAPVPEDMQVVLRRIQVDLYVSEMFMRCFTTRLFGLDMNIGMSSAKVLVNLTLVLVMRVKRRLLLVEFIPRNLARLKLLVSAE